MKKNLSSVFPAVLAASMISLAGCNGKSGSNVKAQSASSSVKTSVGAVQASGDQVSPDLSSANSQNAVAPGSNASVQAAFSAPSCANPIELDRTDGIPVATRDVLPSGKLNLKSLQLYMVYDDNESLSIDADSAHDFKVNVSCNGTYDPHASDVNTTTTNSDGSVDTHTSTHTSSHSGQFAAADSMVVGGNSSAQSRKIFISVKDGQVETAESSLFDSPVVSAVGSTGFGDLKVDHLAIGDGQWVSLRIYALPSGDVELRIKFDFLQNGVKMTEFGSAIYSR